ncbi:MAG: 4-hydroxybutyrate CoA-transferase [Deltaproteobacteria bacterium]|nr:4-hydroxybutyrate CoA-transferase [Deltaproteobacteria bacterium]
MSRKNKRVAPKEAIQAIQPGHRIIIPIGCGLPQTLMEALLEDRDRLKNVEIVGGLQFKYDFLREDLKDSFTYRTWQCAPPIKHLINQGILKYIPMRQGDAPYFFSKKGIWPIDVALVHVSPPDSNGFCSLGVSISHSLPTALEADIVIAEVNDQMPRVLGNCFLHVSQIDYLVQSSRPLLEYPAPKVLGDVDRIIGEKVSDLIEDGSTLQIGIGSIPEALTQFLAGKKNLKFFAMGIDSIVDLHEKGALETGTGKIIICEVLGTKKIFDFVHENPMVEGRPSPGTLNPRVVGDIEKFISVISAIEIDLSGQVNAETVAGKQISAIGGGFDFLQGALFSPGGKSIIALSSTTPNGKFSRIVANLPLGSAVTTPRHCVQYVVTEHGIADLRGKTLKERAEALISIAHPDFREELEKSVAVGLA